MPKVSVGQESQVSSYSPFRESPRVIYKVNPLAEVICQLRFSPLLRIDAELPAAFQETIRQAYPTFREGELGGLNLPPEVLSHVAEIVRSSFPGTKQHAYDFISADEIWTVRLTRQSLSLTTTRYEMWEDFRAHLDGPLKSFVAEYSPAGFTRIGLRYRNLIRPSSHGLKGHPWKDLLSDPIGGLLTATDLDGRIQQNFTQAVIEFKNGLGLVAVRHGLVQAADNDETCYLIDSDFFTDQRTGVHDVYDRLTFFNRQSGRLFRWCISDALHEAMGPSPVPVR